MWRYLQTFLKQRPSCHKVHVVSDPNASGQWRNWHSSPYKQYVKLSYTAHITKERNKSPFRIFSCIDHGLLIINSFKLLKLSCFLDCILVTINCGSSSCELHRWLYRNVNFITLKYLLHSVKHGNPSQHKTMDVHNLHTMSRCDGLAINPKRHIIQ